MRVGVQRIPYVLLKLRHFSQANISGGCHEIVWHFLYTTLDLMAHWCTWQAPSTLVRQNIGNYLDSCNNRSKTCSQILIHIFFFFYNQCRINPEIQVIWAFFFLNPTWSNKLKSSVTFHSWVYLQEQWFLIVCHVWIFAKKHNYFCKTTIRSNLPKYYLFKIAWK